MRLLSISPFGLLRIDKRTLAHWLFLKYLVAEKRIDPTVDGQRLMKRGPAQGEGLEESWAWTSGGMHQETE